MSSITKEDVVNLREKTGAGLIDCKRALADSNGDMEEAISLLRKKGVASAAKKAGRDAGEGIIAQHLNADRSKGILVEVNCETDFVAKNDSYLELAHALADHALGFDTKDAFLSSEFMGMTVAEKLTEQTGVIGEKIEIGGFSKLTAPYVGSYIHAGNKIATLAGLSGIVDNASEIAKNVAMQAAAMNPIALDEDGVDASIVEKEIEIAKDQLRQEGKPEAMLDNIAKGKIKRFFKDNTLVNQDYIKDGKISVSDYVKSADPDLMVIGFQRLALG